MKPRSIFLLDAEQFRIIYGEEAVSSVREITDNDGLPYSRETILARPEHFKDVEIVFSGWGAPIMDEEILTCLPGLRAFFYGAGTVRKVVTDAFWERGIVLTSSYQANAVPVAEYTCALIILSLKHAFRLCQNIKLGKLCTDREAIPGMYRGTTVGIIALGAIGRLVCEMLTRYDVDVVAYDPFASEALFQELNVQRIDSLEALFEQCDVVSLHAPWLKETENMITGSMLASMPRYATFINSSRGAIVDEVAMCNVLRRREDLTAVLDVIQDESLFYATDVSHARYSQLLELPNVFITPHIAGSTGRECFRMGEWALEECRRYLNGEPLMSALTREFAALLA
ncbi:MAG: hydroxyacid dehydrogenase [Verrucomicrobiota bacterium JB024]|nr:hydroxyacid dehydrogenase [Verrucomicrobiota bacterium JB024]